MSQESGFGGETIGTFQAGLPLAIFQTNQVERATARAERSVAEIEAEAIKKGLQGKVARGAEAVNSAVDRIAIFGKEIIPTFEDNLALLKKAFELGEIDTLQISVARARFLELESQALEAYSDYYHAVTALETELGTDLYPTQTP